MLRERLFEGYRQPLAFTIPRGRRKQWIAQ
jgi:hypothetical protein